jgi:hypothetical protein
MNHDSTGDVMWLTHHEPGSAEETFSRTLRFDKYRAMQGLLNLIANFNGEGDVREVLDGYSQQARGILADMKVPRGPAVRAEERANQLERLSLAYRLASGVFPVESPHLQEARTLLVEALKAYERANPPAALDPLLL